MLVAMDEQRLLQEVAFFFNVSPKLQTRSTRRRANVAVETGFTPDCRCVFAGTECFLTGSSGLFPDLESGTLGSGGTPESERVSRQEGGQWLP